VDSEKVPPCPRERGRGIKAQPGEAAESNFDPIRKGYSRPLAAAIPAATIRARRRRDMAARSIGITARSASRAAILAGLIILVVLANLLWPGPLAPPTAISDASNQKPLSDVSDGPRLLHAVKIDANANLSIRLLMTSLQGS